jgi:hypothetical protein
MSGKEHIAATMKVEQLKLFKETLGTSYRESSEMFDRCGVWGFIDDAYEGFHIQGAPATFDEINAYINRCKEAKTA